MVVASKGRCPACGQVHTLPDARSFDREQMGCEPSFLSRWERVIKELPAPAASGRAEEQS